MLGWGMTAGILAGGLVVLTYTFLGGMWSVSMTDAIQFILGSGDDDRDTHYAAPLGFRAVGGWQGLSDNLPEAHFRLDTIGYRVISDNPYHLRLLLAVFLGSFNSSPSARFSMRCWVGE